MYGNFDSSKEILTLNFIDKTNTNSEEEFAHICALTKPMVETVFNQSFAFPSCAKDQIFMAYDHAIGYSWVNDPYVKGSYAYLSPGQEKIFMSIIEKEGEKFKSLFAPHQSLYFAGEHTSLSKNLGTMDAACESGERVARAILKQ